MRCRTMSAVSVMMGAMLVAAVAGVAWAATIQCDGAGDRDPDPRQCTGTNNDDTITGTNKADTIKARGGIDSVMARGGRDRVLGGDGGDGPLDGGAGNDKINAGPNPAAEFDGVAGGLGDDELVESPGQDVYAFGEGWGEDTITGDGDQPGVQPDGDRVCFACGTHSVPADVSVTINLATGTATDGTNTVTWDATVPFIENAFGGSGGDNITGSTRPNTVHGFQGNDTINVSGDPTSGADFVNCGDGTDSVIKDAGDTAQNCESP